MEISLWKNSAIFSRGGQQRYNNWTEKCVAMNYEGRWQAADYWRRKQFMPSCLHVYTLTHLYCMMSFYLWWEKLFSFFFLLFLPHLLRFKLKYVVFQPRPWQRKHQSAPHHGVFHLLLIHHFHIEVQLLLPVICREKTDMRYWANPTHCWTYGSPSLLIWMVGMQILFFFKWHQHLCGTEIYMVVLITVVLYEAQHILLLAGLQYVMAARLRLFSGAITGLHVRCHGK